ncbi:MAG: hypothetical protein V2I57_02040 [Xanthomonadales bacterium]|nr:hypothetical protein [Xanthomonadales bacterium]
MLQLALLSNLGVFLGCKIVGYELDPLRKFIAAMAFTVVYFLPLGLLVHILAPLALWAALKQPEGAQHRRFWVVLITYGVAGLLTVALFHFTR